MGKQTHAAQVIVFPIADYDELVEKDIINSFRAFKTDTFTIASFPDLKIYAEQLEKLLKNKLPDRQNTNIKLISTPILGNENKVKLENTIASLYGIFYEAKLKGYDVLPNVAGADIISATCAMEAAAYCSIPYVSTLYSVNMHRKEPAKIVPIVPYDLGNIRKDEKDAAIYLLNGPADNIELSRYLGKRSLLGHVLRGKGLADIYKVARVRERIVSSYELTNAGRNLAKIWEKQKMIEEKLAKEQITD